jgi:hypothetical protein
LTAYTAARLSAYEAPTDLVENEPAIERSDRDKALLWSIVSSASHAHPTSIALSQLRLALTNIIDVSAQQFQALSSHVPTPMFLLMFTLVGLTMLSTGIRFARDGARPPLLGAIGVVACAIVITMAVDYDRPQAGFVRVNLGPLSRQLQSMQQAP